MVEETAGSRDEEVDALSELVGFLSAVCAADDDGDGLRVVFEEITGDAEDLECELTGGGDNLSPTPSALSLSPGNCQRNLQSHRYRSAA